MAADRHKRGDPVYPRVSAPSVVKFLLVPVQKVAGEFDRSHYRRKGIGYLLHVRLLAELSPITHRLRELLEFVQSWT